MIFASIPGAGIGDVLLWVALFIAFFLLSIWEWGKLLRVLLAVGVLIYCYVRLTNDWPNGQNGFLAPFFIWCVLLIIAFVSLFKNNRTRRR